MRPTTETPLMWRKATHSANNANCVELADPGTGAGPLVRDSKHPDPGRWLNPGPGAVGALIAAAAAGEFDDLA